MSPHRSCRRKRRARTMTCAGGTRAEMDRGVKASTRSEDAKGDHPSRERAVLRYARAVAVVILLGIHWLLAVSAIWSKSLTFDELAHQTGGLSYWKTGDFRLHPENGNLPQRLCALPLLWQGVHFPAL